VWEEGEEEEEHQGQARDVRIKEVRVRSSPAGDRESESEENG
jgi:hypothetical protein